MFMVTKIIRDYMQLLGFSDDAIAIYSTLLAHGAMNLSDLARVSKVERTSLYRNLPKLEHDGLIEVSSNKSRKIVSPGSVENIERLISLKRRQMSSIEAGRMEFMTSTEKLLGKHHNSQAKTYSGIEAMKQALLDGLQATQVPKVYVVAPYSIDKIVGTNFLSDFASLAKRQKNHVIIISDDKDQFVTEKSVQFITSNISEQYFAVFGDRVVYFYWLDTNPYAFAVINKNIAKSNQQMISILVNN